MNMYEIFLKRGFIAQCTHKKELSALFSQEQTFGYIGFDPTATSLHVGSLIPILSLMHLQRNGHRPIVIIGGGTSLIGDPSGKTETRKMLTLKQIHVNAQAIKKQLSYFLDFSPGQAIIMNNVDWLTSLNYIEFLRDIGQHFSMNRMLATESVKLRLEQKQGLSFIEFNYILLQAYDFMHLAKTQGCRLQMGGNDQWGNIIAGIELVRRILALQVYGLTFPLITNSAGSKMGKTTTGTIWLDSERTRPYDFYQYWINTTDEDVINFLKLFTFIPINEINEMSQLRGAELREAKKKLAFELTKIVHGKNEALAVQNASHIVFGEIKNDNVNSVPATILEQSRLKRGTLAFQLLVETKLCKSSSEARRLIAQGGVYVGKTRLNAFNQLITLDMANDDNTIWLRIGKKKYHRIIIKK